jgi:hypothetical protein
MPDPSADADDAAPDAPSRRRFLQTAPFLALTPSALADDAPASRRARSPAQDRSAALETLLQVVPEPIVPARPDLKRMYEACWDLGLQNTKQGTPENGFVRWYIDEAFDDRLFQWDICFALAWAKYGQGALPSIESLDNFYRHQHADGAIAGVIQEKDGSDDQPKDAPWFTRNNLFSWIEHEYYRTTGDASRFERIIPVLRDYARWVQANRRHPNGHYFWSGWSSGMDNSPRSRADKFYPPYSWVDYDANEALAAYHLAEIAETAGAGAVAHEFRALHREIKTLVNRDMWSAEDRFYWDLDRDGSFLKHKTVASFWPMWGRITEARHVEGLVEHLNDPDSFNRPHRVPTLAADHPDYSEKGDYWRGSVWAPTNHMIVEGLRAQGHDALAREIVVNHLDNMAQVFEETGTVWENYAPETAAPGDPAQRDFVGWSADGPIAQLIEYYIGITPDVPNDTIHWRLLTTEEVGLRNLDFGGRTVMLKAAARSAPSDPVTLTIETPVPFTVRLTDGTHEASVEARPDQSTYEVDLRLGDAE